MIDIEASPKYTESLFMPRGTWTAYLSFVSDPYDGTYYFARTIPT